MVEHGSDDTGRTRLTAGPRRTQSLKGSGHRLKGSCETDHTTSINPRPQPLRGEPQPTGQFLLHSILNRVPGLFVSIQSPSVGLSKEEHSCVLSRAVVVNTLRDAPVLNQPSRFDVVHWGVRPAGQKRFRQPASRQKGPNPRNMFGLPVVRTATKCNLFVGHPQRISDSIVEKGKDLKRLGRRTKKGWKRGVATPGEPFSRFSNHRHMDPV
jgi:hypothetical protein